MSCPQYDWKAYTLGELSAAQKQEAETHAASCTDCRMEVANLRLTLDAMSTLRDEEVPHRIAFVSDKVFEPRWWQQLWSPTFAAACVVALAILVHAFKEPPVNAQLQQAQIDAAVARAVADVELRQQAAYEIVEKRFRQMYITTTGMVRQ